MNRFRNSYLSATNKLWKIDFSLPAIKSQKCSKDKFLNKPQTQKNICSELKYLQQLTERKCFTISPSLAMRVYPISNLMHSLYHFLGIHLELSPCSTSSFWSLTFKFLFCLSRCSFLNYSYRKAEENRKSLGHVNTENVEIRSIRSNH